MDIGGVLLSNGWGHEYRKRAAERFGIDYDEMNARHTVAVAAYEIDKLSLDQYLELVVFFRARNFTKEEFKQFMFGLSSPFPEMINSIRSLKLKYGLKTIALSNEAREVNCHRIRTFRLDEFIDTFISSSFVGLRKPDPQIFKLALDVAQVPLERILYIENTPMFAELAASIGINVILHKDFASTARKLTTFGLVTDQVRAQFPA